MCIAGFPQLVEGACRGSAHRGETGARDPHAGHARQDGGRQCECQVSARLTCKTNQSVSLRSDFLFFYMDGCCFCIRTDKL